MSSAASSPFVEDPKSVLSDDSEFSLKQVVSNLQFQLSSTITEKKLLEQDREAMVAKYENLLLKKNDDLNKLQRNFDFLYEQKKQLESKVENQQQISDRKIDKLNTQVQHFNEENSKLRQINDSVELKYNSLTRKYEQIVSDLNYQLQVNDQLEEKIGQLNTEIKDLYDTNDELLQKLNKASTQLISETNSKLAETLQSKNLSLQKTNNQLQLKVDQLLQNKTSVELLRQKNISLLNRISHLENLEEKNCKLEIENLDLKTKFEDFFKIINETVKDDKNEPNESTVLKFINKFRQLQNRNLIIQDKYDQSHTELNQIKSELLDLQTTINDELTPKLESLNASIKNKDELIEKLERQKLLNVKEIEYLRNSLKESDEINLKKSQESSDNKATDQYLSNLEKLVDEYRNEINSLQKQIPNTRSASSSPKAQIGNKRPRLINDDSKSINFKSQVSNLEKENVKLLSKIKQLENELKDLNYKLSSLEKLNSKKQHLHILQLKSNPAAKDQIVKQHTLDLLRKENEDLIKIHIRKDQIDGLIPKSVFERQENDKCILQSKIDQLSKRNNRLRDIYSQKSRDILSIISKYFGYTIEFLPSPFNPNDLSSRIKLVSKYMTNKDGSNNAYLVIDIESKNLKAFGNYEFKSLCEELASNWFNEKGQIPCLLSALNLKIYEKYGIE